MKDKFQIDFVGIGASKCGTTWLGHMLEGHPQLCMSEPKEVHFFNDRVSFRSFLKPHYQNGIEWFQKFFVHCHPSKKKGEITPRYCTDPVAAARIKEHNPDIKIIYCLRSPVDRIWSHYQFASHFVGKEDRDIMTAIREEPEYLHMSKYFANLSVYRELFSDDQIFIIWFEDIQKRPGELLSEIYSFLGVDPNFQPEKMNKKSNAARVSRFVHLQKWIRKTNYVLISMGMAGLIKRMKRAGLNEFVTMINSKPLVKKPIPEEAKNYIIEHVRDDVNQLEKLFNKDLSHWLK